MSRFRLIDPLVSVQCVKHSYLCNMQGVDYSSEYGFIIVLSVVVK